MFSFLLAAAFSALLVVSFVFLSTERVDPEYAQALRDWMREAANQYADEQAEWLVLIEEAAYYEGERVHHGEGPARVEVYSVATGHEWIFRGRTIQGAAARMRSTLGHLGAIERVRKGLYALTPTSTLEARLQDAVNAYSGSKTPINRIALVGALQDYAKMLHKGKDAQAELISSWLAFV